MIQLRGVTKTYNMGGETIFALRDIDLDIQEGEFVAIMGPSGSGKSTLANVIGGLDVPDKGSVLVSSQGSEEKVTTSEDLGKTVFEGFLTVRPLGAATYTFTYKLPFKVSGNTLPFMIQKQPGTNKNPYIIQINGKQVEKFDLDTDKTINLKL